MMEDFDISSALNRNELSAEELSPVWFITGTSSGFGDAFARHAISQGYRIVATARDRSKLSALQALAPDRVLVQRLDVTSAGEPEAAVAAAIDRFGRIDVLINNAGYGVVGAVEETPRAGCVPGWRRTSLAPWRQIHPGRTRELVSWRASG
jgi:NAD(P)-dependent dehydrogenase (short-subunit alcohol dehydrogenase family)